MLSTKDVSAVLVTRGNIDVTQVRNSLIFDDVVIWNNHESPRDEMTYGRVLAMTMTKNRVIYSQDDDIIHSAENQRRIVSEYQPGVLTGCMWPEWSQGAKDQGIPDGYDDLVFMGSGSVFDFDVPPAAMLRYLMHYTLDSFARLWSDTLIGVLAQTRQLDIRFESLPTADDDFRMANTEGFTEQKAEAIERARIIRDGERVWA